MTVIAAMRGKMVSDSSQSQGSIMGRVATPKIIRNKYGWMAACAGEKGWAEVFAGWFQNGMPEDRPKIESNEFCALLMGPDGLVWRCEQPLLLYRQTEPAIMGEESAEAFVLGAVLAGLSLEGAVDLAADHCIWVARPVQIERIMPVLEEAAQ